MRLSFGASRSRARGVASLVVLFLAAVLSGCAVAVPWRVAADPASVFALGWPRYDRLLCLAWA